MNAGRTLTTVVGCVAAAGWAAAAWSAGPARPPKVLVMATPDPAPSSAAPLTPEELARAAAAAATQGVPVAQASLVETRVEVRTPGGAWQILPEGGRVRTGDRLRTGPDSVARLDFAWMSIALAPASELLVPKGMILGLRLESGRVELSSGREDLIKLDTAEARVRGRGRVVVRRDAQVTRVSVLQGDVHVGTRAGNAALAPGHGCVVSARSGCVALALPEAPAALQPGADPTYVAVGERLPLAWQGEGREFQVQVLAFDSEAVLMQRDVPGPPFDVAVPWPGLYRWRVSARGPQNLEGPPSLEGLFQVMPADWLKAGVGVVKE